MQSQPSLKVPTQALLGPKSLLLRSNFWQIHRVVLLVVQLMTKGSTVFERKVTQQRSCSPGEISSAQLSQHPSVHGAAGRWSNATCGKVRGAEAATRVTLVTFPCTSILNRDVWESKRFAL